MFAFQDASILIITDLYLSASTISYNSSVNTQIDRSFPDSQFAITGYNMYRRDRKKGGGGIVVYVRKSLPSYRLNIKTNEMEAILVDFQVGQQHISLLCGYKPPSVNNNIFTDEM